MISESEMTNMQYGLKFDIPFENIMKKRDFQRMGLGQTIFFGQGKRDDWCPYIGVMQKDGSMICSFPSDKYYFEIAKILADVHGVDAVYDDIKHIFEQTRNNIDLKLMDNIYRMSLGYGVNQDWAYNLFLHLYYGMISEENHAGTYLGRSIKMNGIYSLLIAGCDVQTAANECRDKSWREIQDECIRRHIYRY